MKKKLIPMGICCLIVLLSLNGCGGNSNGNSNSNSDSDYDSETTSTTSTSAAASASLQTGISSGAGSPDIIMDIAKILSNADNGGVSGVLQSSVSVGDKVQLVGIGEVPLTTVITGVEIEGTVQNEAEHGQSASLFFDTEEVTLANMQRVVTAKTIKEHDLPAVKSFDELIGSLEGTKYRSKSFGFVMDLGRTGFTANLNTQEGFRISFDQPDSFYSNDILQISSPDYISSVYLYVTHVDAINGRSAAEQLAHEYEKYAATPDMFLLIDKETAHIQIKDGDELTNCFAMIVNDYYIKWRVMDVKDAYKSELDDIMNSLRFEWVQE